jgi:hypothetical protein
LDGAFTIVGAVSATNKRDENMVSTVSLISTKMTDDSPDGWPEPLWSLDLA